jgi:Ca2+-transporting ATPase
MTYVGSIHVPIAGLVIVPVVFGLPLILLPAHIVFLQLFIDPACSLLFESRPSEKDVMAEAPRSLDTKLFSRSDLIRSIAQGVLIFIASALLIWFFHRQISTESLRTMLFLQLVLSNIGLIIADFTGGAPVQIFRTLLRPRNALIVFGTSFIVSALFWWPSLARLFHMTDLSFHQYVVAIGAAFVTSTIQGIWNWKGNSWRKRPNSPTQEYAPTIRNKNDFNWLGSSGK